MHSPRRLAGLEPWRWLLLALVALGGLTAGPATAVAVNTVAATAAASADGRWREPVPPVEAVVLRRSAQAAALPSAAGDDSAVPATLPARADGSQVGPAGMPPARLVAAAPRIRPGRGPPSV